MDSHFFQSRTVCNARTVCTSQKKLSVTLIVPLLQIGRKEIPSLMGFQWKGTDESTAFALCNNALQSSTKV